MISGTNLSKSFGDVSVLEGVDITVESGEFVGLVGPNGAGKTTLLRLLNGLFEPDAGSVTLDETDIQTLSSRAVSRQVGTVPQNSSMNFAFTAEQIVEMGRTPHRSRLDWSDETDAVEAALERTEMLALRDRTIDDLSGGERQRVLLARALAQDPEVLVLDEPTANLDINHQRRVLDLVSDLVSEGRAAVAAIHDLDLAARFCDRLLVLADGEIRTCGPPEAVLTDAGIETAFETRTAVTTDPVTETPRVTAVPEGSAAGRIHVLGHGPTARRALKQCWLAGYDVTLGPAPAGDVAAELAADLGCSVVTVPAFEGPDEDTRSDVRAQCQRADAVVEVGDSATADDRPTPSVAFFDERSTRAVGDGGTARTATTGAELRSVLRDLTETA
ncbi:ATP-binding cassette domain-containing protein [Halovenus halobia]|uniref:ATP-binding cassette domain-containing protein n=1 Tax=Halovenus halobia TaxID=3396622 RepID=UPI003F57B527